LPAAVALADQWQAEIMDTARQMIATQMTKVGVELNADEMALVEGGAAVGYAAALVVLTANGWLSKP
jgi:hypothetical protein